MTYDAMGNVRFRAFLLTHLGRAHLLARRSAEADRCLHTAFEMIQTCCPLDLPLDKTQLTDTLFAATAT